jgi:hypothetical protein
VECVLYEVGVGLVVYIFMRLEAGGPQLIVVFACDLRLRQLR